ncbi:VOC family protein [soil metagenome]
MLVFHHTAVLVSDIDDAILHYLPLFGKESISEKVFIATQGVNVCFIKVGEKSFIELVEPVDENSVVFKLKKKGNSYYHVGYISNSIEADVEMMVTLNYKQLEYFNSEGFQHKRCIFLFSPDGHLIELIEA